MVIKLGNWPRVTQRFNLLDRSFHGFRLDRLQQIIDRIHAKCFERVLIVWRKPVRRLERASKISSGGDGGFERDFVTEAFETLDVMAGQALRFETVEKILA